MKNPDDISAAKLSPALRWYRKTALLNRSKGLTNRGTVRKRRPNADNRRQEIMMRRDRGLKAWNLRVNRLREQGLTTRGTPRIYAVRRGDAVLLKSQVDALAAAIAGSFNHLPAAAQARALELELHLSALRKQLA
jgi:hypothetical protein